MKKAGKFLWAGMIAIYALTLPFRAATQAADTEMTLATYASANETAYITMNNNVPEFAESELTVLPFETYSELDELGRCGVAYANICEDLMPTEKRGDIGMIRPSGWHTIRYNGVVEGNYLYNRCHLIGYQLAGENANEKNLITGTRYFNVEGMLPFENEVADYVHETNNHVLYRVTPVFTGSNLVADGVQMEALSVEDNGTGVCYNVFVYNQQPGIVIDYATGESWLETDEPEHTPTIVPEAPQENLPETEQMSWLTRAMQAFEAFWKQLINDILSFF